MAKKYFNIQSLHRIVISVALFFVFPGENVAQDIHFSQFDASPLNINSALSGNFNGDYRIVANHKNQWEYFTNAYTTYSLSADSRVTGLGMAMLGYGLLLNADNAGDANFGTTEISVPISFHHLIKKDSSLILSIGASIGYDFLQLDVNKLTFNSQFNGYVFDPDLPHGETIKTNNLSHFDMDLGITLSARISPRFSVVAGYSLHHLNQPGRSFSGNSNVRLHRKNVFHASSEINISHYVTFMPSFLYMKQDKYREFNIGGIARIQTNSSTFPALFAGGWHRLKDAAILKAGFQYLNFTVGLSYDINTSDLSTASKGRGGLEFSVIYIFKRKKIAVPNYKTCPVFL